MTEPTIPDTLILSSWRKSSYSNAEAGSCLEVMDGYASGVPVRDSKTPQGPALLLSPHAWGQFVTSIKRDFRA
ncbi:DUF397 domain-containing protein [Streptomyces sp. NPDC005925]|uniref:DUF397 domain-containing protein n=1 Tax=Streptomyces sp. NPDC005925 TaxID=3157172 RepID=UPI0033E21329